MPGICFKRYLSLFVFSMVLIWTCVLARPAVAASTGISEIIGDIVFVDTPNNVARHVYESNTEIRLFLEREVALDEVPVNAVSRQIFDAYSDFEDVTIYPVGGIRSYFLHFDPIGTHPYHRVSGSITFDTPILGVIGRSLTMHETDSYLGAVGTFYPTNRFNREYEYQTRSFYDQFELLDDGYSISVQIGASTDVDQLRVITAATAPIPTPSAFVGGLLGGLALWSRRRH